MSGTATRAATAAASPSIDVYNPVTRPARDGKSCFTSRGNSTFRTAIARPERVVPANSRPGPSATRTSNATASRPRATVRLISTPNQRANAGPSTEPNPKQSTGTAVSSEIAAPGRPSPSWMSSMIGPTPATDGRSNSAIARIPTSRTAGDAAQGWRVSCVSSATMPVWTMVEIMLDGDPTVAEIAAEQDHVSRLYAQLDVLRTETEAALKLAIGAPTTNTPASRSEREAFVGLYSQRLAQLYAVEARLCFGRLDLLDSQRRYVGRIGISDEFRNELLVDWRAPAAEPFYQATAARPLGVVRRRQLTTNGRTVTGVQDEVLDLEAFESHGVDGSHIVLGEGALFASLDVARSGRMRDIVATIQADQDRAIRAPLAGVLVVQGGPGTGKTAVALHRTAFLLYANRERIARSGVLLVGPNHSFLTYIEQVLPTLGETDAVVMVTPGELFPGVATDKVDGPQLAALKGDLRMVDVIAAAVRDRQRVIDRPRRLDVDGTMITLEPSAVRQARDRARRSGSPHNVARVGFAGEVLRGLVRQLANARGTELDPETRTDLLALLHESADVRREVNWCWAPISPARLLRDLYANPAYLEPAARRLTAAERRLLHRDRSAPWTVADVALLDEAAELLGEVDEGQAASRRADADRRAEIQYADLVQDTFGGSAFVSAEDLARRYTGTASLGSVAERAGSDRSWVFGHIVVDEAQELSAMAWRVLMRRVPSRSLTVVGDVAQTGSSAGATSWARVLRPHVGDRWELAELTVNYRTPAQIMDLAGAVVHAGGLAVRVPTSARIGRWDPAYTTVPLGGDAATSRELTDAVRVELSLVEGTIAVITTVAAHTRAAAIVAAASPDRAGLGADRARGEGARIRFGGRGRAGRDRRRVGARAQRPVRGPDPADPAVARRARAGAAAGVIAGRFIAGCRGRVRPAARGRARSRWRAGPSWAGSPCPRP